MEPVTDQDWTIHSLNIHGTFFERACQKLIQDTRGWAVTSTNYPVEFPPARDGIPGRESTLDIWATADISQRLLTLPIECKKNNPDFIEWVFFPRYSSPKNNSIQITRIENRETPDHETPWDVRLSPHETINLPFPVATEGRETRGTYESYKRSNKTKTANNSIQDACQQVAIAKQAIAHEEYQRSFSLSIGSKTTPRPWVAQAFLPVIITTASLFTCNFNPQDIDIKTGEIPYARVTLDEHSAVIYEYPVPRHLQTPLDAARPRLTVGQTEAHARMHIVIVNSAQCAEVLQQLVQESRGWL